MKRRQDSELKLSNASPNSRRRRVCPALLHKGHTRPNRGDGGHSGGRSSRQSDVLANGE